MEKIAIFGAGGFGREVKFLIDQINEKNNSWTFVGFFDDGIEEGTFVNGFKVLGGLKDLNNYKETISVVFAVGDPIIKRKIIQKIDNNLINFPNLIHPNVQIGSDEFVEIGEGCIIAAGTVITVNIKIGNHVILNLLSTVGHDTVINDYASFMPGVNISGEVIIEEGVYVGTGAKIINQVKIGKDTIIGAGAVVSKDIPEKCTAVGVPAKPIKFH